LAHSQTAAKISEEARAYGAEGKLGDEASAEIQAQLLHHAVQETSPPKTAEVQSIGALDANAVQQEARAYGAHGELGPAAAPDVQARLLKEARAASPKSPRAASPKSSEQARAPSAKPSPKKPCLHKDIQKKKGQAQIYITSATQADAGNHFVVTIKGKYRYTCTYTYSYKCTLRIRENTCLSLSQMLRERRCSIC